MEVAVPSETGSTYLPNCTASQPTILQYEFSSLWQSRIFHIIRHKKRLGSSMRFEVRTEVPMKFWVFGIWRRVVWRKLTDVLEEHTTTFFRGNSFLWKQIFNFSASIRYCLYWSVMLCRLVPAKTAGSFRFIYEIYLRKALLFANDVPRPFAKVNKYQRKMYK